MTSILSLCGVLCLAPTFFCFDVLADTATNSPSPSSAPAKLDESSFRIVSERNIFNANRSGGTVRASNTRRPARVESFALTGTMAYEKGVFAFFEGTSSEFTKVLKPDGVIAGHKVVDILANSVKLEMDGQVTELPIGSGLRREDQGAWKISETVASTTAGSSDDNGGSSRSGRTRRGRGEDSGSGSRSSETTSSAAPAAASGPAADQSEVLRKLMERRAKENE